MKYEEFLARVREPGQYADQAEPEQQAAESFGVTEFCRRVADHMKPQPRTAEWDASAVLPTVAGARHRRRTQPAPPPATPPCSANPILRGDGPAPGLTSGYAAR